MVYNSLQKPDSALFFLKKCDESHTKDYDATVYAILPTQMGKAYELKHDSILAEAYYEKAIGYCRKEKIASAQIRHGNVYCNFLLQSGKYEEAKALALENLAVARNAGINEGISNVAGILRKIYTHTVKKTASFTMHNYKLITMTRPTIKKELPNFKTSPLRSSLKISMSNRKLMKPMNNEKIIFNMH